MAFRLTPPSTYKQLLLSLQYLQKLFKTSNCVCTDHHNIIKARDPVVKDLMCNKLSNKYFKKARLISRLGKIH